MNGKEMNLSEDSTENPRFPDSHFLPPHQLWFKAKTINRGRTVLACTFAHLIALKRFTTENFDVLLEDNVRAPVESCANLVKQAREASKSLSLENGVECHFRFLGWLGSLTNLEYLIHTHAKKRAFPMRAENEITTTGQSVGVTPFPLLSHLASDLDELGFPDIPATNTTQGGEVEEKKEGDDEDKASGTRHSRPGGNFMYVMRQYAGKTSFECHGLT